MIDFDKLKKIVKNGLATESSGHDFSHTLRVYNNSIKIAKSEECDLDVIKAAALFHDYAYSKKFFEGEHGNISADLTKPILEKENFTEEQIRKILAAINKHNFWIHKDLDFPIETKILRDADRLDAIGHIGIMRAIAYATSTNKNKLTILKEQLTSTFKTKKGIELSKNRFKVMKEFIKKLESDMGQVE